MNDGFGDDLTVSEQIAEYDLWLHARAWQLRSSASEHDDLVQEGRIAMWKALDVYDPTRGALPSWLTSHANYHMIEVVTRAKWMGMPRRRPDADSSDQRIHASLDELMSAGVEHMLGAAEVLDGLEIAYHHGEIAAALDSLTPAQRKYVFLRFWVGMQSTDLKIAFGYEPHALWTSKTNGARDKLRAQLEHLAQT